MIVTETSRIRLSPTSVEDIRLVRKELEAVLGNPHFASSKRYPAFLAYVVEKTLAGESAQLKERTLGVEVFHRRPDYDTNSDTIVRFAASEVRKRLALVYNQSSEDHPIQIVMSAGSYTPEFFVLNAEAAQTETAPDLQPIRTEEPPLPTPRKRLWARQRWQTGAWRRWLSIAGILCLVALAWSVRLRFQPTAFDRFWQPLLAAPGPVIISPGAMVFASGVVGAAKADKSVEYPYVSLATSNSVTDIVAMLVRKDERYLIEPSSALTLTEIRGRSVVLLGAYNNDWSQRQFDELRFRFTPQANRKIYDSANPAVTWIRPALPYSEADDYAIIARFHSSLTQSPVLVIGGIGKNGTEAATQFVTDPRYLNSLGQTLPKGWGSKNIEIVIKTKVIDGRSGEPTLEAVHVW